jgi:hypothetical protein
MSDRLITKYSKIAVPLGLLYCLVLVLVDYFNEEALSLPQGKVLHPPGDESIEHHLPLTTEEEITILSIQRKLEPRHFKLNDATVDTQRPSQHEDGRNLLG